MQRIISLEGGMMHSYTARQFLSDYNNITLGSYSYGSLDDLFRFPINTVIGRYTSIGPNVSIFQANHPTDFVSMHPFFYRNDIGIVEKEAIRRHKIEIGHDVWFGANSTICPGCHRIGNGAVVGAGSVVTKEVPDYAIIGGNPAHILKMRFHSSTIDKLLESQWWMMPFEKVKACREEMITPLTQNHLDKFINKIEKLR